MDTFSTDQRSGPTSCACPYWRAASVAASLSTCVLAFAASEPSLITGEEKSYGYSWEQELQLGAQTDREISEKMGVYNDPELQAYIDGVGQRILQQSDFNSPNTPEIYRNTKFTFRVIDSPVVNAFALPGGYVYVTRGLLSHVQNEAQLAVVLGHEIAHVAARHASQQARRSQWTQLGVIAGAILGSKILGERGADLAPTLLNLGGQAAEFFLLRYSREAEHESDTLGVNYALRAGYAADQSARFFQSLQRLAETGEKSIPTWKSSHPDPGDRADRVVKIASQIPADTRDNIGEEPYLRQIEGIVIGDDPRQGFARNGVFYHPVLRFQFPVAQGWQLDNQPTAVVMAEPGGQAMMGLRLAPGNRARDAMMQFAQESQVKIVTTGDTVVNGLPTSVLIGEAQTDQGAVSVWNAFIEYDGRVYSLMGYAPQPAFERVRPTFETVAAGFSPLRDQSVANVQPARLKLLRADRTAPFASFVPTALPPDMTPDELAILNQVTLNETINQGRVLKLPDAQALAQPAPGGTTAATAYPPSQPNPRHTQTTYPPAGTYPSQPGYPPQASTYPQPNYPTSPSTGTQGYPPQGYPPQSGQPQYPSTTSTYPQQPYPSTPPPQYPGTNYPPQTPAGTPPQQQPQYPQQQPATTYPQPGTGFPQPPGAGYPQPGYPAGAPPQGTYPAQPGRPQFPQPPSSTNQNRTTTPQQPSQPQQPVWPR